MTKRILLTVLALFLGVLAFHRPLRAQASASETDPFKILTNSDIYGTNCDPQNEDTGFKYYAGCCGAPGRRGCFANAFIGGPTTATCLAGSSLKIDSYVGGVICTPAPAACDVGLTQMLQQAPTSNPTDLTFYLASDIHYFRTSFNLPWQLGQVKVLNSFAGTKPTWPGGVGIPAGTVISPPTAIVVDGDITTHGYASDLGAYRLLWERGSLPDSIQYPVLFGLGNHETNTNESADDAHRMFDYLRSRMGCGGIHMDMKSGNYSWDWQGVHMVQLNTWAADKTSYYVHNSDGLTWLQNDLATYVGHSTRPVMLFQHYGLNEVSNGGSWPTDATAVDTSGQKTGQGYESVWNVIKNYNVVSLFSGHTHCMGNHSSNGPAAFAGPFVYPNASGYGKLIDNFDDGASGVNDEPCSAGADGSFLVTHVSDHYLDVAAFSWKEDSSGTTPTAAYPDTQIGLTHQGNSNAQAACRRRINSQFIPIDASLVQVSAGAGGYKVTNLSSNAIAGPLALQFQSSNLTNYDFLDQCGDGKGFPYLLVNGESGLAAKQSFIVASTATETPTVVALTPLSGASPQSLSFTTGVAAAGHPAITPADQTITIYGPPNGAFSMSTQYITNVQDWLTVKALPDGKFDAMGTATLAVHFLPGPLQMTTLGNVTASIDVTAQSTGVVESIPVEIYFKEPVTVTLTASPVSTVAPGSEPEFTAKINYTPVQIQDGPVQISGIVSLRQQTLDANGNVLASNVWSSANVNSGADCNEGAFVGNNPPPDTVVFGAISNTGGYCPSRDGYNTNTPWIFSEPVGVYALAAYYEGSGQGDSDYAPAVSNTILYRVGDPLSSAYVSSGNSQSAPINGYFETPLIVQVLSGTNASGGAKNALVTFTVVPGGGGQAGSFNGQSSVTVVADSNGLAKAPPILANALTGAWQVIAAVGGLSTKLTFQLTNTAAGSVPLVQTSITGKSGALSARIWTFTMTNIGAAAAGQLTLASVTLTQESGVACSPSISSGVPFTAPLLPSVSPNNAVSAGVVINFGSCAANARFTVTANLSANGGKYTTQQVIGHQFP